MEGSFYITRFSSNLNQIRKKLYANLMQTFTKQNLDKDTKQIKTIGALQHIKH